MIETKELNEMTFKEKKNFLSNDLIERMIAVEQRVSAHFGEIIPYYKTEYYKSLNPVEKKRFEKSLSNKKLKLFWISLVLLPLFFFLIVNLSITGNVISDSPAISNLNLIFLMFFFAFLLVFAGKTILNNQRMKRLDRHILLLERLISKKYLNSRLFRI